MTKILALHFGHNAHALILNDGNIDSYIQRERISCVKEQAGVNKSLIDKCLLDSSINIDQIEQVVITNTQYQEFYFEDHGYFNFDYASNGVNKQVDNFFEINKDKYKQSIEIVKRLTSNEKNRLLDDYKKCRPQFVSQLDKSNKKINLNSRAYLMTSREDFGNLSKLFVNKINDRFNQSREWSLKNLFCPIKFNLSGKELPGFFVDHHLAHTYSAATKSKIKEGLVFTSDGSGNSLLGNLASIKTEFGVFPFARTNFRGGQFFEYSATAFGLDCGKFMGLASYGNSNPSFIDHISSEIGKNFNQITEKYFVEAYQEYFSINFSNKDLLSREIVNFAANVQRFFELQYIKTITELNNIVKKNIDNSNQGIILSGGSALNCPSNSYIAEKFGYENVFIEPSCNDEGLGFGAAMAVENMLNNELNMEQIESKNIQYSSPFLGPKALPVSKTTVEMFSDKLIFKEITDDLWSDEVANMLINNKIGMIIRGNSEIGPRALGNRSIIAIPKNYEVSNKVNTIKNRETWRPLAPACLDKYFSFFFNGPKNRYMLMTCKAKNMYFPGVIHVDGSSRVQYVDTSSQNFYLILKSIDKIINKPVLLLNTSCNRKGEPIINNENIAVKFLLDSQAHFLVTDRYLITKKTTS